MQSRPDERWGPGESELCRSLGRSHVACWSGGEMLCGSTLLHGQPILWLCAASMTREHGHTTTQWVFPAYATRANPSLRIAASCEQSTRQCARSATMLLVGDRIP